MSNPLIHLCDDYLVMEPGKHEQFLTAEQTIVWLEDWLGRLEEIPQDLKSHPSRTEAAKHLLDTACDLEIQPGFNVQWYAVRLNQQA